MGYWLAALCIWASIVTVHDLRHRRVPNLLLLGGVALLGWRMGSHETPLPADAFFGAVVGLAALLPAWWWRILGGGDVKLAGLLGAISLDHLSGALLVALPCAVAIGWLRSGRLRLVPGTAVPPDLGLAFAPLAIPPFVLLELLAWTR